MIRLQKVPRQGKSFKTEPFLFYPFKSNDSVGFFSHKQVQKLKTFKDGVTKSKNLINCIG